MRSHAAAFEIAGFRPEIVGSVAKAGESEHDLDILLVSATHGGMEDQLGVFYDSLAPGIGVLPNPSPCESADHPNHWFVGTVAPNGWLVEFYFRDPAAAPD